jgi:hypothetical protein
MKTKEKLTDVEKKALDIFKRIIRNRNMAKNDGSQWKEVSDVPLSDHIWLRHFGFSLAYDEYEINALTIPNNTICCHGIPVWTICIQREERKRGGCYRLITPLITKIPIDKVS